MDSRPRHSRRSHDAAPGSCPKVPEQRSRPGARERVIEIETLSRALEQVEVDFPESGREGVGYRMPAARFRSRRGRGCKARLPK